MNRKISAIVKFSACTPFKMVYYKTQALNNIRKHLNTNEKLLKQIFFVDTFASRTGFDVDFEGIPYFLSAKNGRFLFIR